MQGHIPNECVRDVVRSAEVSRRVECESGDGFSAIGIVAVGIDAAYGEEGPSRWVPGIRDIANVAGFQKVELVDWAAGHTSREDCKELQQDASGENYERHEADD